METSEPVFRSQNNGTIELMGPGGAIALTLISAWVTWTLLMWSAATHSFRTVERVLAKPEPRFARMIEALSAPRAVLRFFASQVNAGNFKAYGRGQVALGVALLLIVGLLLPRDHLSEALIAIMLALVLILVTSIAPRINDLRTALELDPSSPRPARFWRLHRAYTGLDVAKLLLGLAVLIRWILMA
ncbi:MAG: hypothetical protein ACRD2G_18030 [Terriglobia bacterium]